MYLVSEFAKSYSIIYFKPEEGKAIGLSYLRREDSLMIPLKKFSLGYSPETWDAFTKEALGKGYKLEFLESTGLTIAERNLIVLKVG
jgi:DNA primase